MTAGGIKAHNCQEAVIARKLHCKNPVGVAKQILYRLQTQFTSSRNSHFTDKNKSLARGRDVLEYYQVTTKNHHVLSYSEKMQTPFLTVAISAECFPLCHIADGHFQPIYLCHQHMGQTKQIKWSLTASKSSLLRSLHSPEQPRCQHGFCIHHRADEPSHRSSQFLKR